MPLGKGAQPSARPVLTTGAGAKGTTARDTPGMQAGRVITYCLLEFVRCLIAGYSCLPCWLVLGEGAGEAVPGQRG
jgi:hypothetical protein